jgi:metal-responsive CopG/Arc/MetJ family transcriptional regulator
MRTVIDLPDEQIATLDRLARAAGTSRAAMIREAVRELLRDRTRAPDVDAAFGLWAADDESCREDGLAYQRRLRDEWPA